MKSPPEMRQDSNDDIYNSSPYSKRSERKSNTKTTSASQQRSRPAPVSMEFSASEWNTPTAAPSSRRQFRGNFNPTTRRSNNTTPAASSEASRNQTSSGVVKLVHLLCDHAILEAQLPLCQIKLSRNPTAIDTASLSRSVMYISSSLSFTFSSLNVAIILFTVGIVNSIFFKSDATPSRP